MSNKIILCLLSFLNKIINLLLTLFLIIVLCISLYALYDYYNIYDSSKINIKKDDNGNYLLDTFNDNVIGWINIYDTNINYPIVKGFDNKEYLFKNYKNEYSKAGSIFLDYRNNSLLDQYTIIYGHNLSNGLMFSDIKKYKNKEYFDNHLKGIIYTSNNTYSINVILINEVSAYDNLYNINEVINNKQIINKLINNSINKIHNIEEYDRLIVLSTCSNKTNKRIILLCYLK